MKCFDCDSSKHLAFHKDCPAQIKRMNKKSGILNGVRNQLSKGYKAPEILACLAFASDESIKIEYGDSEKDASETVEVGYAIGKKESESDSEDDLFGTAFERSLQHRLEGSLKFDQDFRNGSAN